MATSKLDLLMPFESIPTTTIHPSSLVISPIPQEPTSPYFYTQYPHSYTYTPSPESSPQSSPQTPTPIHTSRSLKRSYSSISSNCSTSFPTNSSYSHPKRIRTDDKQRNQLFTLPSSTRSKQLDSDNFTHNEDVQGEEGEQTINDDDTVGLRRDIEEYSRLLLRMAQLIEGALGEVRWELDMDGTVGCGKILS